MSSGLFFDDYDKYNNSISNALSINKIEPKINLKIVYIHLTLRCNFDCEYCYNKNLDKNIQELNTNQWISIINKLKDYEKTFGILLQGIYERFSILFKIYM